MLLYIEDKNVDALAEEVTKVTGTTNKTEAVRVALHQHLDAAQKAYMEQPHILAACVTTLHGLLAVVLKDKVAMECMRTLEASLSAALQECPNAMQHKQPFTEYIHELQSRADEIGPLDPTFDMKKFTDDMWGDD